MTSPLGNRESLMRPDDHSGRYWASPPCRVRVDDGKNVSWVDLQRPYALVGSHPCCTLRIRSEHVPEVAYLVCCLRDRIEAWPTAAIAFPRWGAIPPELQLIVGPCSLTFHPVLQAPIARRSVSVLADSEIETRLSWPGRDFTRSFRRPVTIIGDDHPSVLRLHGRGLATCQYAAVVQDEAFWLVNLSPRRMQRSERVRRFREPGETMMLGDATLRYIASKPRGGEQQHHDDEVGIGTESGSNVDLHSDDELHTDIHSEHDIHDEDGQSGMSLIASGIHSLEPDSSPSFTSPPSKGNVPEDSQGEHGKSTRVQSSETSPSDRDNGDPPLGPGESRAHRSHSIGDTKIDKSPEFREEEEEAVIRDVSTDLAEPDCEPDDTDSSTTQSDVYLRVDSGQRRTKPPTSGCSAAGVSSEDEGSARAVLNLVDAALGLVDEAVKEPHAREQGALPRDHSVDEKTLDGSKDCSPHSDATELDPDPELRTEPEFPEPEFPEPGFPEPGLPEESATDDVGHGIASRENTSSEPSEIESTSQVEPSDQRGVAAYGLSDAVNDRHEQTDANQPGLVDVALTEGVQSEVSLTNHDPPILSTREASHIEDPPNIVLTEPEAKSELIELDTFSEPDTNPPVETSSTCDWSVDGRDTVDESGHDEVTDEPPGARSAATEPIKTARTQEDGEMNPIQPTVIPGNATTGPTDGDFALAPQNVSEVHAVEPTTKPDSTKPDSIQPDSIDGEPVPIDPELLTSQLTTRLVEIGDERSTLQQVIRWSAITAGIIIPTTVVLWVINRIYSDWY